MSGSWSSYKLEIEGQLLSIKSTSWQPHRSSGVKRRKKERNGTAMNIECRRKTSESRRRV